MIAAAAVTMAAVAVALIERRRRQRARRGAYRLIVSLRPLAGAHAEEDAHV